LAVEDWKLLGGTLSQHGNSLQWWTGDWWHFGYHHYGERKAMATAKTAFRNSFGTLMNWGYVAGRIETSRRREAVSFSHHVEVAKLEPDQQRHWLNIAAQEKLSVAKLRRRMLKDQLANLTDEERQWDYLRWLENAAAVGKPPWDWNGLEQYLEYYFAHYPEVRLKRPLPPNWWDRPLPPDLNSLAKAVKKAVTFWAETQEFFRRIHSKVDRERIKQVEVESERVLETV
jgi:hypothetical protein